MRWLVVRDWASAREVEIHRGDGDEVVLIGKPRAFREQLARAGDEASAVVDRAARLVAEQVRVNIAHAERARAFDDEAAADFPFAEGEVAGARVEDDVHRLRREIAAGTARDPGVLADFKSEPHAADIDHEIADGDFLTVVRSAENIADLQRPWLEPARFVMDAIAGEVALADERDEFSIDRQSGSVEDRVVVEDRQAE